MKRTSPLMAGLAEFDRKAGNDSAPEAPERAGKPPSRQGAVQVAAFFPPEVRTQLKVLAAEQRRDVQDLLAEALNLIFAKYGRAEIAPRKAGHRE